MQQLAYGDCPLQSFASPKLPQIRGARKRGSSNKVRGRRAEILNLPTRFRACTPKMETPFQFSSLHPLPKGNHGSYTSMDVEWSLWSEPHTPAQHLPSPESARGRLRRFGSPSAGFHARGTGGGRTAGTLAALPASARPAAWASRVRAPGESDRTDRRRSPESPDGPGTRRLGGERANVKPRRTTPCPAGRRLCARS